MSARHMYRLRGATGLLALAGFVARLALSPGGAGAADSTDIVRVDDYIGAPRTLFGRTGSEVERALQAPIAIEHTAVPSYRDPVRLRPARRLSYPGLQIEVLDTGRVRRVLITAAGYNLPFGLDVGSPRVDVERTLGDPQEDSDAALMYLYSDGYPDTVHFHLGAGRVRHIEWNYGSAE